MSSLLTVVGSRQYYLWQPKADLFLNQKQIGKVSLEDNVSFKISPGMHTLYLTWGALGICRTSNTIQFSVSDGENISVLFKSDRFSGNVSLEIISTIDESNINNASCKATVNTNQSQPLPKIFLSSQLERVQTNTEIISVPSGVNITVKRSRTIEHTVNINWRKSNEWDIGLQQLLSASIKREVEQEQGRTYQQSETVEYEVELNGDKSNQYELLWVDFWRSGQAEIQQANLTKVKVVEFQFREKTELKVVSIGNPN